MARVGICGREGTGHIASSSNHSSASAAAAIEQGLQPPAVTWATAGENSLRQVSQLGGPPVPAAIAQHLGAFIAQREGAVAVKEEVKDEDDGVELLPDATARPPPPKRPRTRSPPAARPGEAAPAAATAAAKAGGKAGGGKAGELPSTPSGAVQGAGKADRSGLPAPSPKQATPKPPPPKAAGKARLAAPDAAAGLPSTQLPLSAQDFRRVVSAAAAHGVEPLACQVEAMAARLKALEDARRGQEAKEAKEAATKQAMAEKRASRAEAEVARVRAQQEATAGRLLEVEAQLETERQRRMAAEVELRAAQHLAEAEARQAEEARAEVARLREDLAEERKTFRFFRDRLAGERKEGGGGSSSSGVQ